MYIKWDVRLIFINAARDCCSTHSLSCSLQITCIQEYACNKLIYKTNVCKNQEKKKKKKQKNLKLRHFVFLEIFSHIYYATLISHPRSHIDKWNVFPISKLTISTWNVKLGIEREWAEDDEEEEAKPKKHMKEFTKWSYQINELKSYFLFILIFHRQTKRSAKLMFFRID